MRRRTSSGAYHMAYPSGRLCGRESEGHCPSRRRLRARC